jgi:hypothetical protein
MNKKSMGYKRALFIEQFDKMLRQEELRILKDPKRNALYKLEMRNMFNKGDIYGSAQPINSVALDINEAGQERDMEFIKKDSNYHKI